MDVRVEESGAWVGEVFVPFNQSLERIIKAAVEAATEQLKPPTAVSVFAEASRILRRNSSSIPVLKIK